MSLVTTAMAIWPRNVRQSAATRAVFPLPTGPPIPMRKARVGDSTSRSRCSWEEPPGAVYDRPSSWITSRCKETHLRILMPLGVLVEDSCGARRQLVQFARGIDARLVGNRIDLVSEPHQHAGDGIRVEAEEPDRGGRRTTYGLVGSKLRGVARRTPRAGTQCSER